MGTTEHSSKHTAGKNVGYTSQSVARTSFEKAVFPIVYSMVKDNDLPIWLAYFVSLIEDIQMIAFAWRPEFKFDAMPHWQPYLFNPLSYPPTGMKAFLGTWITALALLVIVLCTVVYIGISFKKGAMKAIWPLRLARLLTTLMGTILIIPIIEVLLAGMDCNSDSQMRVLADTPDSITCFSGIHFAYFIGSLVGLLVFIPWVVAMSAVYVDFCPKSKCPAARVHGRFDLLYVIVRIILTIVYHVSRIQSDGLRIVLAFIGSSILFRQMLNVHPFYRQTMNNVRAGILFSSTVCSFISLITFFALDDGEKSLAAFIVLVIATPIGFAVGFLWSSIARHTIIQKVYTRLAAREAAAKGGPNGHRRRVTIIKSAIDKESKDFAKGFNPMFWLSGPRKVELQEKESDVAEVHLKAQTISRTYVEEEQKVFDDVGHVELSIRYLRHNATEEGFSLAEVIFREGQAQFPNSACLHMTFASYLGAFDRSRTSAVFNHLNLSKDCDPNIDQRFFIFTTERNLEHLHHAEQIGAQNMDVTNYVELQSLSGQAYQHHLHSLNHLRTFWSHIAAEQVDLSVLPDLVQSTKEAQDLYERILIRWPKNKEILRRFAMFVSVVQKNSELAQGLVCTAQELEDSESEAKTKEFMQSHTPANQELVSGEIPEVTITSIQKRQVIDEEQLQHRASRVTINSNREDTEETKEKEIKEKELIDKASSNGSSTAANKERRQLRFNRSQVEDRVNSFIGGFRLHLHISSILILLIFIASFVIMFMMSTAINQNIDDVRISTKSRRSSVQQSQNIRDLLYYAIRNDTTNFYAAKDAIIEEDHKMREDYIPFMQQFSNQVPTIRLYVYGGDISTVSIKLFNIFDLVHEFLNRVSAIRARDLDYYQSTLANGSSSAWKIDGDTAFFLSNVVENTLAFNDVATEGQNEYLSLSSTFRNSLVAIMVIFACTIPFVGLVVFHRFLALSSRRLKAMMSLFLLLPKKQVRDILTTIEEGIENLNEDNDMAMMDQSRENAMKNIHLGDQQKRNHMQQMTRKYQLGLLLILLVGAAMFISPLLTVFYADDMSTLMNTSNLRRTYVQLARHFGMEAIVSQPNFDYPDAWTFRNGEAPALLEWAIEELEELHREVIEGRTRDGDRLYSTTEIGDLRDFLDFNTAQQCYLRPITQWDVNRCKFNETVVQSIGYTYELISRTPLNTMINKYIELTRSFLAKGWGNYAYDDPAYQLYSRLTPHIVDGLQTIDETLQTLVVEETARESNITIAIFVSALVVFITTYFLCFHNFGATIQGQFLQLINILFTLPITTINTIPEIRRYVESGGANLNEN